MYLLAHLVFKIILFLTLFTKLKEMHLCGRLIKVERVEARRKVDGRNFSVLFFLFFFLLCPQRGAGHSSLPSYIGTLGWECPRNPDIGKNVLKVPLD